MSVESEREYREARREIARLEEAIARFDARPEAHPGVHTSHVVAEFRALRDRLEALREAMRDYERREGQGD